MGERILLVNPRKRKPVKKRRSAAQKAATAKLVAFNKAKRRKKNPSKTRTSTKKVKPMARKKARTAAQKAATRKLVAANRARSKGRRTASYRKVRKTTAKRKLTRPSTKRATAAGRVLRRRRRNPIKKKGILDTTVFPALTATGGALALDVGWAYLPLPAQVKSGPMRHVAKGLGAIGLGYLAGMVIDKKKADQMALGALTVVLHQAGRDIIQQTAPAVKMDGIGYYSPGLPVGGPDMGLYVADNAAPPMNTGMYTHGVENEAGFYNQ